MTRPVSLSEAVEAAERRVAQRRLVLRARRVALATDVRGHLSSPVVLLAAAGTGFLLASRRGRGLFTRAFSGLQLALAVLSATRG